MTASTGIIGTGSCLPSLIVTSEEVDQQLGVPLGWSEGKTGIRERRRAPADTSLTDLATEAGRAALESAGLGADEVRAIIVATATADPPVPALATRVQHRLGASDSFVFDLNAACAGFIFALNVARLLVEDSSKRPYVLVIGSDIQSRMTDPLDRRTWPLFGDGAGAVVVGPVEQGGILATKLHTDGSLGHLAVGGYSPVPPGGVAGPSDHFLQMRGRDISELLLEELPKLVNDVTQMAGLTIADVDLLISHQANPKLIAQCAKDAGFSDDQTVLTGVSVGNTGAASVPIGIDTAVREGTLRPGSVAVLAAFGAGMSWGGTVVEWAGTGTGG